MRLGLPNDQVLLVPHDPAWAQAFESDRDVLRKVLAKARLPSRIEHVGSTAIKGVPAKPIVDLVVGLRDASQINTAKARMMSNGMKQVRADDAYGTSLLSRGEPTEVLYHLVPVGSLPWMRLVYTRDELNASPGIAQEYGLLKQELAAAYPESRAAYTAGKSVFLNAVFARHYNRILADRMMKLRLQSEGRLALSLERGYGRIV